MKKLFLLTINPVIAPHGNCVKALKIIFFAFIFTCFGYTGIAQVVITPATGGTVICNQTNPTGLFPACTTLGVITISEVTSSADFEVGPDQLVLNPPAGWQFCGAPVLGYTAGEDISAVPTLGPVSPTSITINFNVTGTYHLDQITISGLQVQPLTIASPPGYIFAAPEAGIIGVAAGPAGSDFGDLRLSEPASGTYNVTGGGVYCSPGGVGVDVGLSNSDLGMNYQLFNGATLVSTLAGTGGHLDFGLQTAAGTYTVKATNGAVCGYTAPMAGSAVITLSASTIQPITGVPSGPVGNLCAYIDSEQARDATPLGIWNSDLVTVDTTGVPLGNVEVQAFASGIATITYTVPGTGCQTIAQLTVNPLPPSIIGGDSVCVGSTDTLSDSLPGGTWASSNGAVATVGSANGIVTGVTPGTTSITYTSPFGCDITKTITVNPRPAPITGFLVVCAGQATTASSSPGGGVWTSALTAVATVFSTVGGGATSTVLITGGANPGGATPIVYTLSTGCATITSVTVDPIPDAITGSFTVCVGGNTPLGDATPGGVWSSSNTAVATIDPTGIVYGVTPGADTISYTLSAGSCAATFVITVNPLPLAILGPDSLCIGTSVVLSDSTPGGTWSSSNTEIAFIDVTGDLTGSAPGGTSVITYTLPTGCTTSVTITVNTLPSPIVSINGDSICSGIFGIPLTVSDVTVGGLWSEIDPTVVTVVASPDGDTATVTGGLPGSTLVTYTLSTGCSATFAVTVNPTPPTPVPTASSVCQGDTVTFTDAITGGIWSSSETTIATIDSLTGLTTGEGSGTATITYTGVGECAAYFTPFQVHPRSPIGATDSVLCQGASTVIIDSIIEGSWSSSNTLVATVLILDTIGGTATVTGAGGGIATITYTTEPYGCISTFTVTVNPNTPIIGPLSHQMCMLDSFVLFDATTGGIWTSGTSSVATISATGEVYGVSAGTSIITYALATGCLDTFTVIVNQIPDPITGIDSVCVGDTIILSDDMGGGVWGSDFNSIAYATPGPASFSSIAGISAGTAIITYTFPATGCNVTVEVTVDPITSIYGADSAVCMLDSIQLHDSTGIGSGIWSSSNTAVATIGASGMLTGVSAGTVTVTYFVPTGACPTYLVITVNPLPSPITGIDTLCVGNTTNLFDTSAGGTGTWTSNTLSIATVTDTSGVVTGVSAGIDVITYALPVTGCVITTQVTVDPLPTGIYGADSAMCNGDSILLRDTTSGGVWASSNTAVATVNDTGYVKGLSPGTSTITYTLNVGACPASLVVTVYPIPVITIVSAPSPPVICKGAPDTLAAFGADTGGVYAWTPAYGLSGTAIFDPIATPTTTTTYEVIGTTIHGCRDSAFITVYVDSALNHLKIVGVDSLCSGLCDTLMASGNPEALFNWHPINGLSVTIGDTIVACPDSTTTYFAVAIDAMGCKDSTSFTVTINPIPNIVVTPNPVIVCRGAPTQMIATTTNTNNSTTTYAWSPDILISCDSCPNPTVYDTFNLVYKVIATTIYGCYDSLNVKASVLDTNVNTISDDTDICIGDSVMLVATSNSLTSNLDVPTYIWSPPQGLNDAHIQNPIANPTSTTTYTVTIRENACFTVVDTVTVRVQPLPSINITPASPVVIVAGTPTTLIATAPNVHAVAFAWVPGNSLNCDTCFDPVATPTANTTYTVTVVSNFGCVNTDTVTIEMLCDGSEVFVPNTFTPNGDGVNDRFFVSGKGISLITNFSVFNRWGELVFQAHNIPANNPGAGWDGTYKGYVLEPDVFIYVVDALCELGTTFHYQGDVSIVR